MQRNVGADAHRRLDSRTVRTSPFALIFVISLIVGSASAAPLCSEVLAAPLMSENKIDLIIENLAEMKLQVDVAMSLGQKTPAANTFLKDFSNKYQELAAKLEGKISEVKLRKMIGKKIATLQGRDKEVEKDKTTQIKKMRAATSFLFDLAEEGLAAGDPIKGSHHHIFLPKTNSVFYFRHGNLYRLDYRKQETTLIETAEAGILLSDNRTLLLKKQDHLETYNTVTGRPIEARKIQYLASEAPSISAPILQTTQSGKRVLLTGKAKDGTPTMSLIDGETGKELLSRSEMPSDFKDAALLNDRHLLIVRDGSRIEKIAIKSGRTIQSTVIPFTKTVLEPPQLKVSGDGTVVTVGTNRELICVAASDLTWNLSHSDVASLQNYRPRNIVSAPGFATAFIESDSSGGARLFSMKPLRVAFDFKKQYGQHQKEIQGIATSPEGDKVLILYSRAFSQELLIDIWHAEDFHYQP
jgi:hypothetical protein